MGLLSNLFGTPTDEQFAQRVSEALRADGVQEPISLETATYSLRIGDDRVFHLGNFYAEFLRVSRRERDVYVQSLVP